MPDRCVGGEHEAGQDLRPIGERSGEVGPLGILEGAVVHLPIVLGQVGVGEAGRQRGS